MLVFSCWESIIEFLDITIKDSGDCIKMLSNKQLQQANFFGAEHKMHEMTHDAMPVYDFSWFSNIGLS